MLLTKKRKEKKHYSSMQHPQKENHLLSWLVKHSQWSQQQQFHSNRWAIVFVNTILTTPIQEMVVCIYKLCLQLPWHIWWQQVQAKCCWINRIMHSNKWKSDYFPPVTIVAKTIPLNLLLMLSSYLHSFLQKMPVNATRQSPALLAKSVLISWWATISTEQIW